MSLNSAIGATLLGSGAAGFIHIGAATRGKTMIRIQSARVRTDSIPLVALNLQLRTPPLTVKAIRVTHFNSMIALGSRWTLPAFKSTLDVAVPAFPVFAFAL